MELHNYWIIKIDGSYYIELTTLGFLKRLWKFRKEGTVLEARYVF